MLSHFSPSTLVSLALTLGATMGMAIHPAQAQISKAEKKSETENAKGLPNIKTPTLGGKQLWTDHAWRHAWKVQQNVLTGHWRLIDDRQVRQTWGSREACEQMLWEKVPDSRLEHDRVFILIHGLMRTTGSMKPIGKALSKGI